MSSIVTKIESQKRNKDRVNIYINEEYGFSCSAELVYYHSLKKGGKIEKEKLQEIVKEDNYIKGKSYAIKLLERNFKTEKYIKDKLTEKEFDKECIERVLIFLREYKFVDDFKYADMFIREKINTYGRKKIKYLLLNKGIEEEIVKEKIYNIDCEKEKNAAYKLAEKKYKIAIKKESSLPKINKKIITYLLGRGYSYEIANFVVTNLNINNPIKKQEQEKQEHHKELEDIYNIAEKRYNIIIKSESNNVKIYRRLSNYLLRKGYSFDDIKKVVNELIY